MFERTGHGRREGVPLHYCGAPLDGRLECSASCEAREEAERDRWRDAYNDTYRSGSYGRGV